MLSNRFDPRKRLRLDKDSSSQGTMSKAEMRKEQKLAILAPDIMETDPKVSDLVFTASRHVFTVNPNVKHTCFQRNQNRL